MRNEESLDPIEYSLLTIFNFFFGSTFTPSFTTWEAFNKDEAFRNKKLSEFYGFEVEKSHRNDHFSWLTADFREMTILSKKRLDEVNDNLDLSYPEVGSFFSHFDQLLEDETLQYLVTRQKSQALKFLNSLELDGKIENLVSLLEMIDYFLSCFYLFAKLLTKENNRLPEIQRNNKTDTKNKDMGQFRPDIHLQNKHDQLLDILSQTEQDNLSLRAKIKGLEIKFEELHHQNAHYDKLFLESSKHKEQISLLENKNKDLLNLINRQSQDLIAVNKKLSEAEEKNTKLELTNSSQADFYDEDDRISFRTNFSQYFEPFQPEKKPRLSASSSVSTHIEDWIDEGIQSSSDSKDNTLAMLFHKTSTKRFLKTIKSQIFAKSPRRSKRTNRETFQKKPVINDNLHIYKLDSDKAEYPNKITNPILKTFKIRLIQKYLIILLIADTILFDLAFTQMLFHFISFLLILVSVAIMHFMKSLFFNSKLDTFYEIGCAIMMQNLMTLANFYRNISSICLIKYYFQQLNYIISLVLAYIPFSFLRTSVFVDKQNLLETLQYSLSQFIA